MKILKTEEEYNQALRRLEVIFDAPADSTEGDEADLLGILIEKYEDEHYPIESPDPIEAIKFRMEQMNMDNNDLAKIIGYKSRVSEIFNRKRKLSLKMIRNLLDKLKILYEKINHDYQNGNYFNIFVTIIDKPMRVIAKKILREFWEKQTDSEQQLKTWFKETLKAVWTSPNDIKSEYPKASILKNGRVVFNICGNKYRLIVQINYPRQWIFIRFIGTHRDYDRIDAEKIQ